MKYIIRISPEITIKSKPVRKNCFRLLSGNIKKHLNYENIDFHVSGNWDHLILDSDSTSLVEVLKNIPGISHFQEIISFPIPEDNSKIFDFVLKKASEYYLEKVSGKTFVVRVKRSGNHDFKSIDVERYIGGGLLELSENSKVSLKSPDITVNLEIKGKNLFIIKERINGIGGYPVGFQDKVVSLISGGFDSGVSTYLMMKRGCRVDYLFFNLGGSAHELGVKQVSYYLRKTFSIPHRNARFISVDFTDVIKEILTKVHHKFRGVVLKRFMIQISNKVAENNYYAIVKGDSLGQVSSQTLKNINVIDKAGSELLLRPLISYNKQEIVDISKQIGTYNFAVNMPEYCGVISDNPSTGSKLEDIENEEKNIDASILQISFDSRKITFVRDMFDKTNEKIGEIEEVNDIIKGDILVDIREPEKINKYPLELKNTEILTIPFYDLNSIFKSLDQKKSYLFYCDKGVLSSLHALYLMEKGYRNIKVYRPKNK